MSDARNVARALRKETRLVWIESPTNPMLKLVDLAEVARIARAHGARTVVDNTFATPFFQRPLEHGIERDEVRVDVREHGDAHRAGCS